MEWRVVERFRSWTRLLLMLGGGPHERGRQEGEESPLHCPSLLQVLLVLLSPPGREKPGEQK